MTFNSARIELAYTEDYGKESEIKAAKSQEEKDCDSQDIGRMLANCIEMFPRPSLCLAEAVVWLEDEEFPEMEAAWKEINEACKKYIEIWEKYDAAS